MAISRSDMERQLRKDGGVLTLEDAKRMAPPGESLAYINPEEAALLKSLGGAGEDINGTGIKSYFIKKIFKKAKRAVKKVVKSPIGKAAILAGLTFGVPGTSFGGLMGKGTLGSFFGKGSLNPFMAKGKFSGLGSLLNKAGLVSGTGGLTGLGKLASIAGVSGIGGLMAARGQQEEDDEEDFYRGEGLDIADIVRRARMNDPEFRFLPGAEFTGAYAEGGKIKVKKIQLSDLSPDFREEYLSNVKEGYEGSVEDYIKEFYSEDALDGFKEGGITSLEKDPEYKGWKKIYMMNPDAAESHPKHTEFENYLKSKENKKAEGGIMNLGGMEMDLRGGGFVPLGAKEKADDVPARLSKNEFVMTADAVRAAGGGSVDKGADKMYKLMKGLEAQV